MKPLAILGGTFDPVHNGHLRIAWEAAEQLDAEVCLLPAHVPPHRGAPVASTTQRVAMLEAALEGQTRLSLDTRELARTGPSYTVDTLAAMRRQWPQRSLILLMGTDAFLELDHWHQWQRLFALAHIAILIRPGYRLQLRPALEQAWMQRKTDDLQLLHAQCHGAIAELEVTSLDISSSHIRQLLARGREPRFLVPDTVLASASLMAAYRDADT